ncbi:MAG TPA: NADPH-dependent F420 reductase [Acidimicrobiales bacterium]|nr:NADPH-dependent F420 reductase [Acidimicrobiales bacterium]
MQVGFIGGTGPLGRGLGVRLALAGANVAIGSRSVERAAETAADLRAKWAHGQLPIEGAANEDVAASDIVVVATPWDAAIPTVRPLAGLLDGKVVVSVGNALVRQAREMHALVPPRGSVAGAVQAELPGALVAAACHHLPAGVLEDLEAPLSADVLVCSDHAAALAATMAMVGMVDGLRPLDAGSLASAAPIEAFTAVLVNLNIRYKGHSTPHFVGLEHVG